jgi:hypothetical protein
MYMKVPLLIESLGLFQDPSIEGIVDYKALFILFGSNSHIFMFL